MAANVVRGSTFHIPDTAIKIQIPVSEETLNGLRIHNFQIHQKYPEEFEKMRRTVEKVTPYALVLLATVLTSPVWIPCSFIAHLLLGPLAFIAAGAMGYGLVKLSEKVCDAFFRQCPEISGFIIAKLTDISHKSQEDQFEASSRQRSYDFASNSARVHGHDDTSHFHNMRSTFE